VRYLPSEEENHDWSNVPTFKEEEAAQAEEAREAAEADRTWEREHGGGWAVEEEEDDDEPRSAYRRPLVWVPKRCTAMPKPVTWRDFVVAEAEDAARATKIVAAKKVLDDALTQRDALESDLVVALAQQPAADAAWDAASAVHARNTARLNDLSDNRLPAVLAETAEERILRTQPAITALQAVQGQLAALRALPRPPFIERPGQRAPQREWTAFNAEMARRTAAATVLANCEAQVGIRRAALADLTTQPERAVRDQIAAATSAAAASCATLATCRESKIHATLLRIRLQNLDVFEARATADLHAATYDGFDVILLRQPKSAATVAREAKAAELAELETNPPKVFVDGWEEDDREAIAAKRTEIEAKYATKLVVAEPEPTAAQATVMRDATLTFAELLRMRHDLPEAAPPEPVRARLFPNARILTADEERARRAMVSNLFVANLSDATTDEDLQGLFRPYGRCKVKLPKDRQTGVVRGFAFINFDRIQDAQAALAGLNGYPLHHMIISVKQAEEREEHPVYAAGGGGDEEGANHDAAWAQLVGARLPANFL
jgi:hypothetical protein